MAQARAVKLNSDTSFLKLIAIITMLVDHLGARIFPEYTVMRMIGRVAFPLFAYCVAAGCVYTRSIGKYALRLAIMAVVVQPLYMETMGHAPMGGFDWLNHFYRLDMIARHYYSHHLNILFTLAASVLIIWSLRDQKYIATAVLALAAYALGGRYDYGVRGVVLVVLFYGFIDRPLASLAWVGLFMWHWGMPDLFTRLLTRVGVQTYALFALPLIYIPMNTGIKAPKWLFYAFYPAHLVLIYLLQYFNIR